MAWIAALVWDFFITLYGRGETRSREALRVAANNKSKRRADKAQ